jgi:hypothetical protein
MFSPEQSLDPIELSYPKDLKNHEDHEEHEARYSKKIMVTSFKLRALRGKKYCRNKNKN